MVDWKGIERTGEELRSLGHRRAELVRAIRREEAGGNREQCRDLTDELESISLQCQELLSRQHGMLAAEFSSPGADARAATRNLPTAGRGVPEESILRRPELGG